MGRVYLRRPVRSDANEFVAAAKASVSMHHPWVFPAQTLQGYYEYLERIQDVRYEGYFVCRISDDRIVGSVNLSEIARGALQCAFVGYWAVAELSGKGMMAEGLSLVFDQAFGPLGLHRLEVNIQPGNERSIRLASRLGLLKEGFSPKYLQVGGEWRDHERWALRQDQWSRDTDVIAGGVDAVS